MGLSEVPHAGELFRVVESDRLAREFIHTRNQAADQAVVTAKSAITLEQLFERFQAGELENCV